MNLSPIKIYIICTFTFLASLLLWFTGVDDVLTLFLADHDIQAVNSFWRFVSNFGLGKSQLIFCLFAVAYFIHATSFKAYPRTIWRVFVGTFYIWVRGLCLNFKPVQRSRFYWQQQAKYVQQLPLNIRAVAYAIPIMFWAGSICAALKILIARPRPKVLLWEGEALYAFAPTLQGTYHSLPSGHTTTTFALLAVLLAVFPQHRMLFWV